MRITEEGINHVALLLIDEYIGNPLDYSDDEEVDDRARLIALGYIHGVVNMSKNIKKVLKIQ